MSVLIKDMEIPKSCNDCEFIQRGYPDWCDLSCRCRDVFNPAIRPDWCPLEEAGTVKHGRWIKNEDRSGWHCSCCGKDDLYAYPYTENNERELQDFYCPNCGAKMDGVIEDE